MSTDCKKQSQIGPPLAIYNPNTKRLIKINSRLYKNLVKDGTTVDGKFIRD